MKILIIDSIHPVLQEMLENKGFLCDERTDITRKELLYVVDQYEGIVLRSKFRVDKEILDRAINLKFIARSGAGMENIDVEHAAEKNILCFSAPEGNRDAVAEHAMAMLLALFNKIIASDQEVRQKQWNREQNRGIELSGKTVGIIGYGNTGAAFAKRLACFDVEILAYDKYKTEFGSGSVVECSQEEIFYKADILSLHIPLTEETAYLVDHAYIGNFKKPIYLINTSRGKILNTADLVKNLKSGKVKGACLDVLEYERLSFENLEGEIPPAFRYLAESNNVILTPHVAGWTDESYKKLSKVLAEKIIAAFSGVNSG